MRSSTWICIERLLWRVTPSFFILVTLSIPAMGGGRGPTLRPLLKIISLVFVLFRIRLFFFAHFPICSISAGIWSWWSSMVIKSTSSANLNMLNTLFLGFRSDSAIEYEAGPIPDPCTTLALTLLILDTSPKNLVLAALAAANISALCCYQTAKARTLCVYFWFRQIWYNPRAVYSEGPPSFIWGRGGGDPKKVARP